MDPGLSWEEAARLLQQHGPNLLRVEKRESRLARLLRQFQSPVVLVLLGATLVSALVGSTVDALAILAIVLLNSLIGYLQESRAEEAIEALRKMSTPRARVLREGTVAEIPAADVCPGDILVLEAGDDIAADARILHSHALTADQSVLTGESLPVEKGPAPVPDDVRPVERTDLLFAGTTVTSGSARALVLVTGGGTQMGRIAELLAGTKRSPTPLQARLEQVSGRLLLICAVVVGVVAVLGLRQGYPPLEVLLSAISLAVAAIPEGLPAVVTLALAFAIRRMAGRNAIVRHLPAVETLGSTQVICTDKTGTLTTGRMSVRDVILPDGSILDATGDHSADPRMLRLARSAVLCSNASRTKHSDGSVAVTGDPTEVALLELADTQGDDREELAERNPRSVEWPFDSARRRMSVLIHGESGRVLHAKGAPEAIFEKCELEAPVRRVLEDVVRLQASHGRRMLAIAERQDPIDSGDPAEVESGLELLGLVAIADPPRPESLDAVRGCLDAGIRVVMITGDHPETARAIAGELQVFREGDSVLSGSELARMDDHELRSRVREVSVYARVSPEDKLRVVRAWRSNGFVVAMTGDGVNDAPALREASIGIAMGKAGTEVARRASAMVLADDHFATIVSAVEEGRAIFGNIRRTISYLLTGNLAEILIMLGAALAGWPIPLAPIQLLWINLVTDGLPALALAAEPVPAGFLRRSGGPSPQSFLDRSFSLELGLVALLVAVICLSVYGVALEQRGPEAARTLLFTLLVFEELLRSVAKRSETATFMELGPRSNLAHLGAMLVPLALQILILRTPSLHEVFHVGPIGFRDLLILLVFALIPMSVLEIRKLVLRRRGGGGSAGLRGSAAGAVRSPDEG